MKIMEMTMHCIYCNKPEKMAQSHVISNFIRIAVTGIEGENGVKKYQFNWIGQKNLPSQDLPKPHLLCVTDDSKFGEVIEGPASKLLVPNKKKFAHSGVVPKGWTLTTLTLDNNSNALHVARFSASDEMEDEAMRKFPVLTAWRALHHLALEKQPAVLNFLASSEGKDLDAKTKCFLNPHKVSINLGYEYPAEIYLTGPNIAVDISKSDVDLPFAYAYLEKEDTKCVAVLMGFWLIIWPLQPDSSPHRIMKKIRTMVLADWFDYLRKQF